MFQSDDIPSAVILLLLGVKVKKNKHLYYCNCSYLIGYGENQISEGGDFLRFTGMTKIPTISFCWPKFYPNDRGPKKPSSVNDTAPSKNLNF